MTLVAGTVLSGRYRLEEPLGAGATAAVWRARDVELGRAVAIKVLLDDVDPELAARFTREGHILGRLNHPNVVPVLAAGSEDGKPYLVMALVEGRSLKERLAAGPLAVEDAVAIVADVAAGLATAHHLGVVHRDVKPANILCGDDGVPRLVDFGIARASDLTTMTRGDVVMGTAAYLSPEQAQGEGPSPASDVYALGCVLFELLTGTQPFESPTAVGMAYRHVHDEPPAPSTRRPEVPAALDAIVLRCLAKDPARRFADAGGLEQALRRWPAGADDTQAMTAVARSDATAVLPTVAAAAMPPPSAPRRAPIGARAWGLIGAVVAAILLVAVLTAATGHRGSASQTSTTTTSPTTPTSVITSTSATTAPPLVSVHVGGGKHHGKH